MAKITRDRCTVWDDNIRDRVAGRPWETATPAVRYSCVIRMHLKNEFWTNLSKITQIEQEAAGSAAVWTEADNREAEAGKCQGARDSWVAK